MLVQLAPAGSLGIFGFPDLRNPNDKLQGKTVVFSKIEPNLGLQLLVFVD